MSVTKKKAIGVILSLLGTGRICKSVQERKISLLRTLIYLFKSFFIFPVFIFFFSHWSALTSGKRKTKKKTRSEKYPRKSQILRKKGKCKRERIREYLGKDFFFFRFVQTIKFYLWERTKQKLIFFKISTFSSSFIICCEKKNKSISLYNIHRFIFIFSLLLVGVDHCDHRLFFFFFFAYS